jgi:hypothetical protein
MPKNKKGRSGKKAPVESPASVTYDIQMSEQAQKAYQGYFERAEAAKARGETSNSHITALNMIDFVIENVIPRDPFSRRYALTGKLSQLFRMQKDRLRICWMGSSVRKKIYIVFISETLRKAGDINDPYRLLTNMVLSGEFDAIFEELGLKRPGTVQSRSTTLAQ